MSGPVRATGDEVAPGREDSARLHALLPQRTAAVAVVVVGVALAAAALGRYGLGGRGFVGAVLCPALVLLTAIDLRHRLLPNVIVFPASAAVALILVVANPEAFATHAIAGAAFAAPLLVVALAFPAGLGMGDVKLALLIGLALGSRTGAAVFVAALGSLVMSSFLLARHGRVALQQSIPFGPVLALGALVAYFFA